MHDDRFDVFFADEFEEVEASGVEESITRHCLDENVENGFKEAMLDHLTIVMFVIEIEDGTKILDCGCEGQ